MNKYWFRLKAGDLFKRKDYVPVVQYLADMRHYTNSRFTGLDLILDYREMSINDHIQMYIMLNTNGVDSTTKSDMDIYYVENEEVVYMRGSGGGLSFQIWINNVNGDYFHKLWKMVYGKLFGQIPRELNVSPTEKEILKLANYNGTVILTELSNKDATVSVDVIANNVHTNAVSSKMITMGDERLSGNNTKIHQYNIEGNDKWLLASSKMTPNDATIYTCHMNPSGACWDNYIGRRHNNG